MSVYDAPAINNMATGRNVPPPESERSLGDLFGDLTRDTSRLVRQEMRLAKAEMTEKAVKAGKDVGLIAGGGVLALLGAMALTAGMILALAAIGVKLWISAMVVGLAILVVAALVVWQGIAGLKRINPVPVETIESLKEDQRWIHGDR